MKKKPLVFSALASAIILSAAAAKVAKDPVVMTVNGKDIPLSEFEYLYNKNNSQQMSPQSIDDYVDMFLVYKLKVAEAESEGLDKTPEFKKELDGYCKDLARPYLRDTVTYHRLLHEAYDRMATQRLASHIMLPMGMTYDERQNNIRLLDSIRAEIVADRADFADMARKYSSDRSAEQNGGSMGYVVPGRFPYLFEKAVYDTPVGEISQVVNDAPYGFHIIRVEDERPNPGKVEARHILKLTQGLSEEDAAKKKAQIDSIYTLLIAGADFSEMAKKESEDPGSAAAGGALGTFGPGQMVKEFEDAAFSLAAGEISKPFKTSYGYHIVQTLNHLERDTYEEALPMIDMSVQTDTRARLPEKATLDRFREENKINVDTAAILALKPGMDAAENAEAAFKALDGNSTLIAKVIDKTVTVGDIVKSIPENTKYGSQDAFSTLYMETFNYMDDAVRDAFKENLYATVPDYRNLVDEYRDGILLFEISNRNVWDKSAKDAEGLENFFRANKDKYAWKKPHYKGYVIFATSDSIADAAKQFLASNVVESDSLVSVMRDNFGRPNIKVEKVITGKGDNAIVDNVAFGGEKPSAPGRWVSWFAYDGKVIDEPEEAADVKGAVSADYQQELEKQWVDQLRKKYKVKVNKNVVKKLSTK